MSLNKTIRKMRNSIRKKLSLINSQRICSKNSLTLFRKKTYLCKALYLDLIKQKLFKNNLILHQQENMDHFVKYRQKNKIFII